MTDFFIEFQTILILFDGVEYFYSDCKVGQPDPIMHDSVIFAGANLLNLNGECICYICQEFDIVLGKVLCKAKQRVRLTSLDKLSLVILNI